MKAKFINLGQAISKKLALFFHRKRLIRYAVYLGIILILYLCRIPIFKAMGNYLMPEDEPRKAEAVYVLGGATEDRARKAAQLYKNGFSDHFICTGEHVSKEAKLFDTLLTEAQISASFLIKYGVPKNKITIINKGKSTREEANIIFNHVHKKYRSIIILSSRFHLRRVRNVFEEKFEGSPVNLVFVGAPASDYNEKEWWKNEKGLIMVNNEYVKLFYYWWTE